MSGRSHVTITLGRSGQVVKRGRDSDEGVHGDLGTSRRSVRDRLGNAFDSSRSKRQRRGSPEFTDGKQQDIRYCQVRDDDLRFKLMRKNSSRLLKLDKMERNDIDLREKLSRTNRGRLQYDEKDRVAESRSFDHSRRIPSVRSADDLLHLDSQRKSYSGWTSDGLRHRSADKLFGASRAVSPQGRRDTHLIPSVRSADPSRPMPVIENTVIDSSRAAPFMTKQRVPGEPAKPVMRLPPPNGALLPISNALPKSSYVVGEPLTVGSLLNSLGLGKYAILFQAEEVDMTALKQMGDNDLKELGIPMGPRKKILLALAPRVKTRHP